MSDILVHTIPGSPFGRAVLMTLEEKGAPYRIRPVNPAALKAAPHLAVHPFGRVPALQEGDLVVYETQAILRHLDRRFPEPRLTPADLACAARMDQVMNVNDWYLFQGVGDVIGFERVVAPMVLGRPADEAAIAKAMPKAGPVFRELERLLGDGPYFTGHAVSLADILVAPQLDILSMTPEWPMLVDGAPRLAGWLERMRGRLSMGATTFERVSALAAQTA